MYKSAFLVLSCLFLKAAVAQYYFQDIVTLSNTGKNFQALKANNVKRVSAISIEKDGTESEGFGVAQLVDGRANTLTTVTSSQMTGTSTLTTRFNNAGMPATTTDSSANTVTTVTYQYNAAGKLSKVHSISHEPDDTNHYSIQEDHQFFYSDSGRLIGMDKITNQYDTVNVVFRLLENGLPGQEQWFKKGRKTENWYYYYDDQNRLTDIVRFNTIAQKMLPDYIFEYNEAGRVGQQTVVLPGTNFYRIWLFEYNENGLKKSETIFNKNKEQEGRIVYDYE